MLDFQASQDKLFPGKLVNLVYEGEEIEAIVIDPNGLGDGSPTFGMGLGMTERHVGIDQTTLSRWIKKDEIETHAEKICMSLKLPSGKRLTLMQVKDENNREQIVIEASDWAALAKDVLKYPGKTRKETLHKIIDFMGWFTAKGLYATFYTTVKGSYTASDDASVSQLMAENEALKAQLEEERAIASSLDQELALTSHQLDRLRYDRDELQEIAHFNRRNCWEAESEVEYLDDGEDDDAEEESRTIEVEVFEVPDDFSLDSIEF